ncbi:MAG: dihydroxyacetone kinase subunit L [Ruminococcus sp.]|nr:dihydroxyacetone kinase subunit L [Ruminococcus sp.]
MGQINVETLQEMFFHGAELIIEKEPRLTEIDSVIGDGDHGTGMKRGFSAVKMMLCERKFHYVDELCQAVSLELIKSMGGASGVIFGTMFFGGIGRLPHGDAVSTEELADYFYDGEQAIERRGRSKPGQKTMLDALYPAVCALKEHAGTQAGEMLAAAYQAAAKGAEKSKGILPKVGRSKNFREEALGLPDPGAVSVSYLFRAFSEVLGN